MKKLLTAILLISMFFTLLVPMSYAQEQVDRYVPEETFTREELLAMDPELDSDSDGLSDVIELVYGSNRYDADTDGDGVTDYTEFCITCTDVLVPDGQIDTDGDGLTNAEETVYETNPDDLDTDNDNLGDYEEIMVLHTDPLVKNNSAKLAATDVMSPVFLGNSATDINPLAIGPDIGIDNPGGGSSAIRSTLYTSYDNGENYTCSPVTYTMNTDWFFFDKTAYKSELAVVSSILSALAYDLNYLCADDGGHIETSAANAVYDWMDYHSFSHPAESIDLDYNSVTNTYGYSDQHVSEMFVGHRTATYGSSTKNIICVVIRGTNGTLDEWHSNFDLGDTDNFSSISNWTNANNHMGFDITANRLNSRLSNYMSANGLSSSNSVLWITGHSRGGALANVLAAKRIDAGYNVYAYTFASPATTERTSQAEKEAVIENYPSIFNIINEDDFVPQLPLCDWDFVRYGVDKPASIETDGYADDWDTLTGLNYSHSETTQSNAITRLTAIAANRDACYSYPGGSYTIYDTQAYLDESLAEIAASGFTAQYPTVAYGTYRSDTYGVPLSYYYFVEYQPAILMMLMAEVMVQPSLVESLSFVIYDLPASLISARSAIVNYAISNSGNSIKYPHYVESYYLLTQKIS